MHEDGRNWTGIAVFVVVLIITVTIGGVVIDEVGTQLQNTQQETIDHGTEVYGNETIVVSSDDCYDYCAQTTDSMDRRQRALLITLDEREVWTGEFKLTQSVPGHSIDSSMAPLIEEGIVIQRDATIGKEYRYVGPDGKYADSFSQDELQIWIADQLNAYNGWYTLDELASSMPASETEVAAAVEDLKANRTVKQAREGEGNWIVTYHTAYAHHTVDEEPYTGPGYHGLVSVVVVVLIAVLLIGVIQRFRNSDE